MWVGVRLVTVTYAYNIHCERGATSTKEEREAPKRATKGKKEGGIVIGVAVGDGWREKAPKDGEERRGEDGRGITSGENRSFGEGGGIRKKTPASTTHDGTVKLYMVLHRNLLKKNACHKNDQVKYARRSYPCGKIGVRGKPTFSLREISGASDMH